MFCDKSEKIREIITDKSLKIDRSLSISSEKLKGITPDINKTDRLDGDKRLRFPINR